MNKHLQKAFNLSRKTGDRLIVVDSSGNNDPFVILPIDEYEQLIGFEDQISDLTEEQLIDRINRDIASWKTGKKLRNNESIKMPSFTDEPAMIDDYSFDDDVYDDGLDDEIFDYTGKFDDDYEFDAGNDGENFEGFREIKNRKETKKKSHWQIPSDIKEGADEVIEEDRQYLEEVPF